MRVAPVFSALLLLCGLTIVYGNDLSLHLEASVCEIEIGQPFGLSLQFENVGREPLCIDRPITWSERSLEIIARGEGCTQTARFTHVDGLVAMEALRFVPLLPGEKFQTTLPLFNLSLVTELDLVLPGEYSISAVFVSEALESPGAPWPVWRGRCSSTNSVSLTLVPPSEASVSRMCSLLRGLDGERACWYFRYVKDPTAANELIRLFKETSTKGPPPSLVEAIMYQGRPEDATVLWEASKSTPTPPSLRRYYASAAMSLREQSQDPCYPRREVGQISDADD